MGSVQPNTLPATTNDRNIFLHEIQVNIKNYQMCSFSHTALPISEQVTGSCSYQRRRNSLIVRYLVYPENTDSSPLRTAR